MKNDLLLSLYSDLKEVFDEHKIENWLVYGALLGYEREGRLLSGDEDIDIAIWQNSLGGISRGLSVFHQKNIQVHFSESGHVTFNRDNVHVSAMVFSKKDEYAVRSTFTHMRKFKKTDYGVQHLTGLDKTTQLLKYVRWVLSVPVYVGDPPRFISVELQDLFLCGVHRFPMVSLLLKKIVEIILSSGCSFFVEETPLHYFTELENIDFCGLTIKAPVDRVGYLKHKYGDDWHIPKKDYVYFLDSKSERRIAI